MVFLITLFTGERCYNNCCKEINYTSMNVTLKAVFLITLNLDHLCTNSTKLKDYTLHTNWPICLPLSLFANYFQLIAASPCSLLCLISCLLPWSYNLRYVISKFTLLWLQVHSANTLLVFSPEFLNSQSSSIFLSSLSSHLLLLLNLVP